MRFLIVDDDEAIHMYLERLLSEYGDVTSAMNGAEALEAFQAAVDDGRPFDAVFMDILMPEMDGHKVTTRLREMERKQGLEGADEFKLVMITSLSDTKNVSKAFFKGYASCYIVKPFEKEKVLEELKANRII